MTIRVRFAPSPTGNLHIGGARTALFNWAYARKNGGKFLLRVEDTDLERSTLESREAILEALVWQGLNWDEDIVIQSSRRDIHVETANRLLAEGKAYKCFATTDDLGAMRERALTEGRTRTYERTWRDRTDHPEDRPFVVRFKVPTTGTTTLDDQVMGKIHVENDHVDDFVILRSDGSPTYNFVVVCDDVFMNVTHVVRGQDHVSNTFKQVHVYAALDAALPTFAHLPLIDGLSKRKGSTSVQDYRDQGFVAEAVNNYIARLGWSHGDVELMSPAEFVELFSLEGVNRSNSTYDEVKFKWVNSQWIQRLEAADLAERLLPFLAKIDIEITATAPLVALVAALQPRSETLVEMADQARFAFVAPTEYDEKGVKKWMKAGSKDAFCGLIDALEACTTWDAEHIEKCFADTIEAHEIKMGKLAQPVRVAITGTPVSPPIDVTLAAVQKDDAIARMHAAVTLFADPQ